MDAQLRKNPAYGRPQNLLRCANSIADTQAPEKLLAVLAVLGAAR